jgi:alpha-tubulin suppressor-like RCC1 family protein/sugar lactone lactonase YvrE
MVMPVFLPALSIAAKPGDIITYAGGGTGTPDSALHAVLSSPRAVAVDTSGALYIPDRDLHTVLKVTKKGIISTIAGIGSAGFCGDGGPAVDACLSSPRGIAVDAAGNIYIADSDNQRIRKVDPKGMITTIAGNGVPDFSGDDGPAIDASINFVNGLAVDTKGNLYIADSGNNRIRYVDASGVITTFAGNGTQDFNGDDGAATAASLSSPYGVAIGEGGVVYIADSANNRIRMVDTHGIITTVAGNGTYDSGGDGGLAINAGLDYPYAMVPDSNGNLFISDTFHYSIRKVSTDGFISTVAGTGISGYNGSERSAITALLDAPRGLTVDAAGTVYFADNYNHRVRAITADGMIQSVAGGGVAGFGGDGAAASGANLDSPSGVTVDTSGSLYIADTYNHRIRMVDPGGVIMTVAGTGSGGYGGDGGLATNAMIDSPWGVALDVDGNIYFSDMANHRVRKINIDSGIISTIAGNGNAGYFGDNLVATLAQLNDPRGIAVDNAGNIFIADTGNHSIRKVTAAGIISTVAGTGTAGYFGDGGPATAAQLMYPRGVSLSGGSIYIADTENSRVRKISPDGTISTVAGNGIFGYAVDGALAHETYLAYPHGVAVKATGNVIISDTYSNKVFEITSAGIIITRAGNGLQEYSGDGGPATLAALNMPTAVTTDAAGNLFIADTANHRIRQVMPPTLPVGSIVINGGTPQTTSRRILFTLNCTDSDGNDCVSMRLSVDGQLDTEAWTPFVKLGMVILPGTGLRSVLVEFRDAYDQIISCSDSITVVLPPPTGSFVINGGALLTFSQEVMLSLGCRDKNGANCQAMRISTDGAMDTESWVSFSTSYPVTLPAGNGSKQLAVEFRDTDGIASPVYTGNITLFQQQVSITSSPAAISPTTVTFTFSAPVISTFECRFDREEGAFSPCTSPLTKTLPGGTHVFEVRLVDPNSGVRSVPATYSWTVIDSLAGAAYTWGRNNYGQLGVGSIDSKNHPIIGSMPAPVGLIQISAHEAHVIGLRSDKTVWVWGSNLLDYYLTAEHPTPVQIPAVVGGFEDIQAVAAGGDFNLALKSDGTVWAWGYNYYGELGDTTRASQSAPVQIQGLSGVTKISAGSNVAMALKTDGTVVAWGSNGSNQLGIGSPDYNPHAPAIVPGLANITQIAACYDNLMLALDRDGAVWSWGSGVYASLGRTGSGAVPAKVSTANGMGPVSAIACGAEFAMVVSNGVVWTWGYNWYGQLGIGSIPDANGSSIPVSTGFQTNGVIAAGTQHAFAVSRSNTLYGWGTNYYGELGNGLHDSSPHPIPQEVGYLSGVTGIAAGNGYSIALTENWIKDAIYTFTSNAFNIKSKVDSSGKIHVIFNANGFRYSTNASGAWTTEVLSNSSMNNVDIDVSGAGGNETIHIVYLDNGQGVYHAYKSSSYGGSWSTETVVAGVVGSMVGGGCIVADAAGNLHVSYSVNQALYYLSKPNGGSWPAPYTVESVISGGHSLAVGNNSDIHIAYQKNSSLYYNRKSSGVWVGATLLVSPNGAQATGIAPSLKTSGSTGSVIQIAYTEYPNFSDHMQHYHLKFITNRSQSLTGPETGPWVDFVVDNFETATGVSPSLEVKGGKIGIAYFDQSNQDLKYASALDQNGPLKFRLTTVDFEGDVGSYPSLNIDTYGISHMVYTDATNSALKYASNADILRPYGTITVSGTGSTGYSTTLAVTLGLWCSDGSGSGCWQMKFSSDNQTWTIFENFAATRSWQLSSGDGSKRVYVKFKDGANNWSGVGYADVFLDTVKPTGTLGIGGINGFTSSRLVLLNTSCSDAGGAASSGCSTMKFSTDGSSYSVPSLPVAEESSIFLPGGDGLKDVSVVYADRAGNESVTYHGSITLDSTPPVTVASPAGGDKPKALTVQLSCSDGGGSGCASTWYSLDGGSEKLYNTGDQIVIAGIISQSVLTYYSIDLLGNREPVQMQIYTFLIGTTTLTLDIPPTLLQKGLLDVSGKLTRLPDSIEHPNNDMDLFGLPVSLTITGPAGSLCETPCTDIPTAFTYTTLGHYQFTDIDKFNYPGMYTIKAQFGGTGLHQASSSTTESLLVGAAAGYAIIVEGKVDGEEGLRSHNKTTNRIYSTLKERGFEDDNIMYFNYGGIMIPGVDAIPAEGTSASQENTIRWAIETWARSRMNGAPAPLYVVFVDHGNTDTLFIHPDTITPGELNSWLSTLEANLSPAAKLQKRIVILGACYSGSFIDSLKKGPMAGFPGPDPPFRLPDAGRIIIASAAGNEQSYKGPNEPDGIRSGEFFMEELFKELKKGVSLKAAFSRAAAQTRAYTSQGSASANSTNSYSDRAVQHPLLEDDGVGTGSNTISDGLGDGAEAAGIHLGIGVTNASLGPADIKKVTVTRFLGSSENQTPLTVEVFSNAAVSSAWFEVKIPALTLAGNGQTGQLDLNLPRWTMTLYNGLWQAIDDSIPPKLLDIFETDGKYEVFYFTKSTNAEISEMRRSVVYKDYSGNQPPAGFNLITPALAVDPAAPTKVRTAFNMVWEASSDADGLSYTVQIARDNSFSDNSIAFQKEEIEDNWLYVDNAAGLNDGTDYFWRVLAVDGFGARTISTQQWSFTTDNSNLQMPCMITGTVDGIPPGSTTEFNVIARECSASDSDCTGTNGESYKHTVAQTAIYAGGTYFFSLVPGRYYLRAKAPGFISGPDVQVKIVSCPPPPFPALTVTPANSTLQVSIIGIGRAYQSPTVANGIDCSSTSPATSGCHATVASGTGYSLIADANNWKYRFSSWGGAFCNSSSATVCGFTLNADAALTATFSPNYQARVNTIDYASLQDAYSNAATVSEDTIKATVNYVFLENLLLDLDKTVTIDGGYSNLSNSTRDGGATILRGSGSYHLSIRKGKLLVRGLFVR